MVVAAICPIAMRRLARGAREPRLTTILCLANGFDVNPGELLDGLGGATERRHGGS